MRTPRRRSLLLALALVVAGFFAWRATQDPWYLGAFKDGKSWEWVALDPATLSTYGIIPSPTGERPPLYTVFGVPAPVAWILAATAVGLLAHVTRLGLLALAGVGAAWMARASVFSLGGQLTSTEQLAERFVPDGSAMMQFADWTWVVMGLLVLSAAQITYSAHVERREQVAAGEEPEPNLLDTFAQVQTAAVTRMARPSGKQETKSGSASTTATTSS